MFSLLQLCLLFIAGLTQTEAALSVYPKWPPTYQMNSSTIVMTCNYSGYMNQDTLPKLARFGVVDIDWSNAKALWANTSPMDCQERLLAQAQAIKAINPSTKVFVYRNLVKALPWFTDIREKLLDPQYNKYWFLRFKPDPPYHMPPCTNTSTSSKCSMFYHDQLQTPEHPGQCTKDCDCGEGLPCGEYLYDHRNASLRQWLTDVFIMNSSGNTGAGNNDAIDGYYIDDGWSDHQDAIQPWMPKNGFCDTYNKFGGPSEEDYLCAQDMNLSAEDVSNITAGWRDSQHLAQNALVDSGNYNWQLMHGVNSPNKTQCINWMRGDGMRLINESIQYSYIDVQNEPETQFEIDLAIFLLVRGPYGWLGWHWNGCHNDWIYEWNDMLDKDYGEPIDKQMIEIKSGVFQRKWTKCIIKMDCNQYKAGFNFTNSI